MTVIDASGGSLRVASIGNALSANVVGALLPHVLHAAKLISAEECQQLLA